MPPDDNNNNAQISLKLQLAVLSSITVDSLDSVWANIPLPIIGIMGRPIGRPIGIRGIIPIGYCIIPIGYCIIPGPTNGNPVGPVIMLRLLSMILIEGAAYCVGPSGPLPPPPPPPPIAPIIAPSISASV